MRLGMDMLTGLWMEDGNWMGDDGFDGEGMLKTWICSIQSTVFCSRNDANRRCRNAAQ